MARSSNDHRPTNTPPGPRTESSPGPVHHRTTWSGGSMRCSVVPVSARILRESQVRGAGHATRAVTSGVARADAGRSNRLIRSFQRSPPGPPGHDGLRHAANRPGRAARRSPSRPDLHRERLTELEPAITDPPSPSPPDRTLQACRRIRPCSSALASRPRHRPRRP